MAEFVKYNPSDKSITFFDQNGFEVYTEIGADEFDSTAAVLDWIFQINGKSWCTPELLKEFIDLIEEIAEKEFGNTAQGIFCPAEAHMRVDWKTKTSIKIR